jgi:hypothetical protein
MRLAENYSITHEVVVIASLLFFYLTSQHIACKLLTRSLSCHPFSCHFYVACSEQYPLAEVRVQEVGDKAAPAGTAITTLQELLQHIEANQVRWQRAALAAGWRHGRL